MKSVFIVEDEPALLRELKETFPWRREGCRVIGTSGTLDGAQRFLRNNPADILITDIKLPDGNGLDLITTGSTRTAIVITGYQDVAFAQRALRAGAVDFLMKPIDDEELCTAVRQAVLRCSDPTPRGPAVPIKRGTPVRNPIALKALAFIRNNYQSGVSLSEAAEQLNITESHLASVFKAETGITFVQALTAYRMNVASTLLQDYRYNVAEVAEMCGYHDAAYFSKVFRRHHDISPGAFRKKDAT